MRKQQHQQNLAADEKVKYEKKYYSAKQKYFVLKQQTHQLKNQLR